MERRAWVRIRARQARGRAVRGAGGVGGLARDGLSRQVRSARIKHPVSRRVETALRCAVKTAPDSAMDFGGGFERSKKHLPGPPPPGATPPRRSLGGSVIQNCAQRQRYSERPCGTLCAVLEPVPRRALSPPTRVYAFRSAHITTPSSGCTRPQRRVAKRSNEHSHERWQLRLTLPRGALGECPGERSNERAEECSTGHPGTAVDGPMQPPCTQAVNRAPQGASRAR